MAFHGSSADDFDFTALTPAEAVAFYQAKTVGGKFAFDWRDVWQEEHARAFVVAKAMTVDLLDAIRAAVDEAITDGIDCEDFRAHLEPILRAQGWWGRQLMTDPLTGEPREVQLGSVRRLGIIYDTNLRTSLSAGKWRQVQDTKAALPYLRYLDPDPNPRPQHLDWSGLVLRADDPWWGTHWPPNGWNCKCEADSLDDHDLDHEGYQLGVAPPDQATEYFNERTGTTEMVPAGIDPGFAHNPGIAGIQYAADRALAEKLATTDPAIARAVTAIKPPKDEVDE